MTLRPCWLAVLVLLLSPFALTAAPPENAETGVNFEREIRPILHLKCVRCHSGREPEGGFSLETRELLLKGGDTGKVVLPGNGKGSLLVHLVSGEAPDRNMPPDGDPLTKTQVALLARWIDEQLPWTEGFRFRSSKGADLTLHPPELPPAARTTLFRMPGTPSPVTLDNPIDRLLIGEFPKENFPATELVSDPVFARRVYLDLLGILPTPEQLQEFQSDPRPDKRERLVEQLLADNRNYADHWLTFWNDALRNAYRGTGFIDDGRRQITGWLYQSLFENKPYDQFVRELIDPVPGSEGFTRGIVWRGVVNASQRRELQAAQNLSQVFLGLNLKCASCHDSFIHDWTLDDSHALAAVFAEGKFEIYRCDKPTGRFAEVGFLYPQLGKIDPAAPRAERQKQLAAIMTKPENGLLTRTIVNRLWDRTMGRGIVMPVDAMDQAAWNPELLDWLANDLVQHDFDLKRTLFLICSSKVYQLPAVRTSEAEDGSYTFRGPQVKRLSAEQFVDAIASVTGNSQRVTGQMLNRDGRGQGGQLAAIRDLISPQATSTTPPAPFWIWSHPQAHKADPGGRLLLRKTWRLESLPAEAPALITCDNEFILYVNGKRIAASETWNQPVKVDLKPHLKIGENLIAVEAINWPDPETKKGLNFQGANPGGFLFSAIGRNESETLWTIVSDDSWLWSRKFVENWNRIDFEPQGWQHTVKLIPLGQGPWNLQGQWDFGGTTPQQVRSSLAMPDPLLTALGLPNREQVVTRRDSWATTLQALELTNGETLNKIIQAGAKSWLNRHPDNGSTLIRGVYQHALNREPTPEELAIALELVGSKPTEEGTEDLLWIVFMLPEFQLIY